MIDDSFGREKDRGRKIIPDDYGGPSGPGTGQPGTGRKAKRKDDYEWLDILERARRQQKFNTVMEGGWLKEPEHWGGWNNQDNPSLGLLNLWAQHRAGENPRHQALGDITEEDLAYLSSKDLNSLSEFLAEQERGVKPRGNPSNMSLPNWGTISKEELAKYTDPAFVQAKLRSIGTRYSMMTGRGLFQDIARGSSYDPFSYIPQGFFS